ncbi:hypothetical protein EJ08DRAFT_436035 [Tothia fuscella]|uniref:Roadblock/LAMTOR2 domain-containing protein n=1 Tax=Tothia fuscella TaxID=1048955 RepID=A0A9P4P078_9PEZI|nr:hypothetical protein EJ08DRAFT_436035 [Tothia fuscella]
MADPAPAETLAQLTRLSQKPGVQSTLLLSRKSGAIVRTSGLISKSSNANPNSTLPASVDDTEYSSTTSTVNSNSSGMQSAEDVARAVFKFVEAAGGLVGGLEGSGEDEGDAEGGKGGKGRGGEGMREKDKEGVKLLRVRTRRHEFVVVPSDKFILVAIHDTPPA